MPPSAGANNCPYALANTPFFIGGKPGTGNALLNLYALELEQAGYHEGFGCGDGQPKFLEQLVRINARKTTAASAAQLLQPVQAPHAVIHPAHQHVGVGMFCLLSSVGILLTDVNFRQPTAACPARFPVPKARFFIGKTRLFSLLYVSGGQCSLEGLAPCLSTQFEHIALELPGHG